MKMTLLNIYYTTSTHDTILFFTNKGKVYRTKGYEIPEFSRTAKGIPIINLLGVDKDEWINAIIPIREFGDDQFLFFTTKQGISKTYTTFIICQYSYKWFNCNFSYVKMMN